MTGVEWRFPHGRICIADLTADGEDDATADGGPVLSLPALIVALEENGYLATQDRVDGRLRVVLAV